MAAISEVAVEAKFEDLEDKKPFGQVVLQLIRRKPLGAAGAMIVIVMILMAVFANVLTPYDPVANSFASMTQAPSLEHWLGTDTQGRPVARGLYFAVLESGGERRVRKVTMVR